jgi:hypothetical protein
MVSKHDDKGGAFMYAFVGAFINSNVISKFFGTISRSFQKK